MTIDAPDRGVPRDRWGRPLVVPPGGGKATPYTRATTFVDCLEDKYNLQRWQQRMVALGLAGRPDLLLAVASVNGDRERLDAICGDAREAAQASAAATTGTALHSLTEVIDRGEELPPVPDTYRGDLEAYRAATGSLQLLDIERFVVHDELQVGGTFDRLVRHRGRVYCADIKTGSIQWGMGKIAMQLAVYARSVPYDHSTHERGTNRGVDQQWAIVIHLPAGQGVCELHWVDIAAGWEGVQLAAQVRAWRTRGDLARAFTDLVDDEWHDATVDNFERRITEAHTVDDLRHLYHEAAAAGIDVEALMVDFLRRKDELEGAA